ncbi:MAG TPA: sulfatase-like hydrolase/transferase [Thermoanaerobaculia bacterium]|nr:sulfatase-like hydrolase/transferase [Thermoanaerobaculia bacterium]
MLLGFALWAGFVDANRYLTDGYPRLALDSLRRSLNVYALGAVLLFALIELTYFLLGRRWKRPHAANAALWLLIATGAALAGLRLSPWTPAAHSLHGAFLFGVVALVGLWLAWLAACNPRAVRRGSRLARRWLGGFRPAGLALLVLIGANAAAVVAVDRAPRPRLNVLLITIDALRADHLGVYGYPRPTSPNIDRLAGEGVTFRYAVTQWPLTSPSFAAMMSSTYGHTNGLIRNTAQRMPDRPLMLAELLKDGGYGTWAAVGNVNLARVFNFDQGFDTYREIWRQEDQQKTERITRVGLDLLGQAASGGRPFFLWLHYFDPHARYEPPKPFDQMFVGDRSFDGSWRVPLNDQQEEDLGGISSKVSLGKEDRVAYYVAQYDAEIRYVDQQVGILLKELEARGLAGNTLVVLTSDHGESLGDHNYFFEHGRFPYDDCVHVPLIVRVPGEPRPGEAVRSPVQSIDIVPTILDLAGLPVDPRAEGKSLRLLLRGEHPRGDLWDYAFTESGFALDYQRSITSERYKLIYVPDAGNRRIMRGRELELYDLEADPHETRNLIDERPEVAALLKRELWRWMAKAGPTAPPPAAVSVEGEAEEQLRSLGYIR